MLDLALIRVASNVADKSEIQGKISKPGDETNRRLRMIQESFGLRHGSLHFVQQNLLHFLRVRLIGDSDRNGHSDSFFRKRKIGNDALSQLTIRDDDGIVLQGAKRGRAPADSLHKAFLPAFQTHIMTRLNRSVRLQVESGKEIAQGVLQGYGHCQASDSQRRDDWS